MAQKGKPAPHVKGHYNPYKGFPNMTLHKLLNSPREPYFRSQEVVAGVRILGGRRPIVVGGGYQPGLATIPQRAGPVIIIKGAREQARRQKQMGRGAS